MDMFRHRSAPLLQYPCFLTTVVVTANSNHLKITGVLLDSGASTNVIGRKLTRRFGLSYYPFVASMQFSTANGRVSNNEEVDLMTSVAGVWQKLSFVVSDAEDMTMILGTPACVKYKVGMKWGAGGEGGLPRQTSWP